MKEVLLFFCLWLSLAANAQIFTVRGIGKLPTPTGEEMVATITPDGSRLLLTTDTYRGLTLYSIADGTSTTLTTDEGAGYEPRFAREGATVVYRATSFTPLRMTALRSVDIDGGETGGPRKAMATPSSRQLLPPTRDLQGLAVSDGALSVVSGGKRKAIILSGGKRQTLNRSKLKASAAVSGSTAPLLSIADRQLMISTGDESRVLSPNGTDESYIWPSLSPDGKRVLYYVCGDGAYTCDLDGGNVRPLGELRAPRWFDDETVVGMLDKDDGEVVTSSAIVAVSLDGRRQTLTPDSLIAQYPQPAAQAGRIAFSTTDGGVYIINVSKE